MAQQLTASGIIRQVENWLVVGLFALLAGTVFLQFFTRYVLGDPFGWTEEIARVFLIMGTYLGAAVCVRDRANIKIAFLFHYLPKKLGQALKVVSAGFCLAFYGYAAVTAGRMAMMSNRKLLSVDISFAVVTGVVAFGFALMALHQAANLVSYFRDGRDPLFGAQTPEGEA